MCVNYIANQMLYWYGASHSEMISKLEIMTRDQLAQLVSRQVVIILTISHHSVQL